MRKLTVILICFINVVVLSSCQKVIVTSSDELLNRSWQCENLSGMTAEITFYDTEAEFTVCGTNGEREALIWGALAIDSEHFYITDRTLKKTYTFSYKVYTDRAEITYMDNLLTFYPVDVLQD